MIIALADIDVIAVKFSAMAARKQKALTAASHLIQSHPFNVQPV